MTDRNPPVRYVIFHRPGPNWVEGVSPLDQPGAAEHTAYMSRLHDAGNIDCAGPLLTPGAGGMCVLADGVTGEQADAFGREDPGVTGGLITFEVHPWMQVYRSS